MFSQQPYADPQPAPHGAPAPPAPMPRERPVGRPSAAFVGASWVALLAGATAYLIGLYNAQMSWSEKGFYLTLLLYGLFSAVAVQKAVRDRMEDVPVSTLFYGLAWASLLIVLTLLTVGLWNADLLRSEKGFYAMSFALSAFAAVAVQKNVRDLAATGDGTDDTH